MSYALVGEFTVKAARNRGNIPNTNGPGELTRWYVDFVDANGEPVKDASGKVADAYWQRKPDAEVKPGDTVYGKIEEGQYGLRFKMEKKPDGSYGGSEARTGTGGGKSWQPESERDPERSARILRQHSQSVAVQILTAMGAFDTQDAQGLHRKIQQWCDFLDEDVLKAANRAGGTPPAIKEGSAPHPEASPSPGSQTSNEPGDEHHLDEKLNDCGVVDGDERRWLVQAWEGLDKEKQGLALAAFVMGDLEAQTAALKRLREIAGPMPAEFRNDPDSELPF